MVERQLYARESIGEIDRELGGRGFITVRPHSRFVDFRSTGTIVEIMHVAGSITHNHREGADTPRESALMLNQQVRRAIRRAEYEDIGINFIALPEFFEVPLPCCMRKNVLAEFIAGAFGQKNLVAPPCCSA